MKLHNNPKTPIKPIHYDEVFRWKRDKGWMETDQIIANGITSGMALEIGPGPGYLGLEWLKKTKKTSLKGLEFRNELMPIALKNSSEYRFEGRVEYQFSEAEELPYDDHTFSAVISTGSLHEWKNSVKVLDEIDRVLMKGGRYFISDLKRNMNKLVKIFLKINARNKLLHEGLDLFICNSYTMTEIEILVSFSELKNARIKETISGIEITGLK
jgi:ubiquinone/menaquinone biosynthesis C-methylase UbiE